MLGLVAASIAGCGSTTRLSSASSSPSGSNGPPPSLPALPEPIYGNPTNGQSPKALLIMIHGGAWQGISPSAVQNMLGIAAVFQVYGFETMTVDYRGGAQGISDAGDFYRQARRRVGPAMPICAVGVSAGGHIALMVAVRHPDLNCVIDLAGPTDLPALAKQPGGAAAYQYAVTAFGTKPLARLSPALHVGSIKAKLLLIFAANDPLVPVAQGREMHDLDSALRYIELPPATGAGAAPFVHTGVGRPTAATEVNGAAAQQSQLAEVSFLNAVTGH